MSAGIWNPDTARRKSLDGAVLQKIRSAAAEVMRTGAASSAILRECALETDQWLMRCDEKDWARVQSLPTDEIMALVRFFTLVEAQVPGWDAGGKSPVIPLVKVLKSRDAFGADLRRWIKSNTKNRYLPYGSALPLR